MPRHALLTVFLLLGAGLAQDDFQPIPEDQRELYTFDLERHFFASPELREECRGQLLDTVAELESLQGSLVGDATVLLHGLHLLEEIRRLQSKLIVGAYLRYATDTAESHEWERAQETSGEVERRVAFVKIALQSLDDDKLGALQSNEPALSGYEFLIESYRRDLPHTLGRETEEALAALEMPLSSWSETLYQLCRDRTEYPIVADSLSVDSDFSRLMRDKNRELRQKTWEGYFSALTEQHDLYEQILLYKLRAGNTVAQLRGYSSRVEETLHDLYLTSGELDSTLSFLREQAPLYRRYQEIEAEYQARQLHLEKAFPWDMRALGGGVEMRFTVGEATGVIQRALGLFGEKYLDELSSLLDPEQRRLDLVSGPRRVPGAFAWGASGREWLFYSQRYDGYLSDVLTLAHEAGHAVHFGLVTRAGISPLYDDGPRYFTEGFAMLNELLVLDYVLSQDLPPEKKLEVLRELCGQLFATVRLARLVLFEVDLYKMAARSELRSREEISEKWEELGREFSIFYGALPTDRYSWVRIHHFFTHPLYNINYVYANLLATTLYAKLREDPKAVAAYLELLEGGFAETPRALLQRHLKLVLTDRSVLEKAMAVVAERVTELEKLMSESPSPKTRTGQ